MKKQTITTLAALLLSSLPLVSTVQAQSTKAADRATSESKAGAVKDVGNVECPIGGGAVGSMQEGSHVIHKGYRVGLCCDGCKKEFAADPDKYLKAAQADAAANTKKNKQ